MKDIVKKAKRLVMIARLYYEEDMTQSEIAKLFEISRPMVSKLLKEAKQMGIVTIEINDNVDKRSMTERFKYKFHLDGGIIIPESHDNNSTDYAIAEAALEYLQQIRVDYLGIGWGHIIGCLVEHIEYTTRPIQIGKLVCPLIGNGSVGVKNYHSNELIRTITEHSQTRAKFLYSPACVLSEQEYRLTKELDNYQEVYQLWEMLDAALINIDNFPSVPDFASQARYGSLLDDQRAVARILNYYVNSEGVIIHSDIDYAIQIPLRLLNGIKHVIGICSANTEAKALQGALKTGLFNHVITSECTVKGILDL